MILPVVNGGLQSKTRSTLYSVWHTAQQQYAMAVEVRGAKDEIYPQADTV
jgi:hypothetical protein